MAELKLECGTVVLVDDNLLPFLEQLPWKLNHKGYVVAHNKKIWREEKRRVIMYLHRLVNQTPEGLYTDHVNGDKLDNRRENLRTCTVAENNRNRSTSSGKSAYQGVSWLSREQRWVAEVYYMDNGKRKRKCAGYFKDETEAAKARDELAKDMYGEFAKLNFPQ